MAEVFKGKKYNLTDAQIRGLANICYREQGSGEAGVRACATHMLNYYEKYQTKKYSNPFDCTVKSGWYGTESFNRPYINGNSAPQSVINYVTDVIKNGNRSLPSYVDEYDCLSDVKTAKNNGVAFTPTDRSQYKKDVTKVTNVYGSTWTFYCFPDGAKGYTDAFGYISKPAGNTEKPVSSSTTSTASTASNASSVIEKAVSWAEGIAADQSHGYSQQDRWGPNYDCSSLVINSYKKAGVPIDINQVYYTGNMQLLKNYGFVDVTKSVNLDTGSGLKRGDILYYHISGTNGHTAMYSGNGKIVHARGQSYGSPASGDQGTEIAVTSYSRSKWQYVLRYGGGTTSGGTSSTGTSSGGSSSSSSSSSHAEYEYGDVSSGVKNIQKLLNKLGYGLEVDGEFGIRTYNAVVDFQGKNGLTVDGVVGAKTMAKLKAATKSGTSKNTSSSTNKQKADGSYTVTKSVKYVGKAVDNNLNVRSGPGTSYANIKSWPRLEKGYKVDVCDTVRGLDGFDWLYVRVNGVYGFVNANYIVKV